MRHFQAKIKQAIYRRPLVIALIALVAGSAAADEITVHFFDRETIKGELDKRTNAEKLYLRTNAGSTKAVRSFRWSAVKGATYHGKQLTTEKLRKNASRIAARKTTVRPFNHNGKPGWLGGPTYAEMVREALGMIGEKE